MPSIYSDGTPSAVLNTTNISTSASFQALRSKSYPDTSDGIPSGISYLSAPCGAGKSFAVESFIADKLDTYHKRMIYVGPSVEKLNECHLGLLQKGVPERQIVKIHSDNTEGVVSKIVAHLKAPKDGSILLITHAAFALLPYFPDRKNTLIFHDEHAQVDKFYSFNMNLSAETIRPYLLARAMGNGLVRLKVRKGMNVDDLIDNPDTALDGFRTFLRDLKSKNYAVYTWASSYDRVFNSSQEDRGTDAGKFKIQFLAVLRASIFENCCIIGANFEGSMFSDHIRKHGYNARSSKGLEERLWNADAIAGLSGRVTIYYCMESRYLKKSRTYVTAQGTLVRHAISDTIADHIGEQKFLLFVNKDDKGNSLRKLPGATLLPGKSQGMNKYQHFTNVVFVASIQRTTPHYNMLKALGYNVDAIQNSTLIESAYQAISRGDTRNKQSTKQNHIYVADRVLAEAIGRRLGVTNIVRLGDINIAAEAASPKKVRPNAKKRLKVPKSIGSWEKLGSKVTPQSDTGCLSIREEHATYGVSSECCIDLLKVTTQQSQFAKTEDEFEVGSYTLQDFIKWMRTLSETVRYSEENWLQFTLSTFRSSEGQDGHRRLANFDRAYGITIDIDGGILSKEQWIELFWSKAGPLQKHSFIICSSYSRNQNDPNRYHVIFPFLYPCTSLEVYGMIYEMLKKRLVDHGYDLKAIKFDENFASANHTCLLPCKNPDHPDWQFFETYGTKTRDFSQYAIDPRGYDLIQSLPAEIEFSKPRRIEKNTSPTFREKIEAIESRLASMTEGRRTLFFSHAATYWNNGYTVNEVYDAQMRVAGGDKGMIEKAYQNIISICRYEGIENRPKKRRT